MSILKRVSTGVFLVALLLIAAFPLITDSDSASAQRARRPVTLQPGGNFIGWFDGEVSVRVLFQAIPVLESVRAWGTTDPFGSGERGWLVAHRDSAIPPRRPLYTLAPGMGLYLTLSGAEPVDLWLAPKPAAGMVELSAGANLVAWMGSDATEIADAMRGVGQSLESAHIWDSTRGGWCSYRPVLGRLNSSCIVQPGDAMWVYVDRDINWLQPTDVPPRVLFAGAVPKEVRDLVDDDLDAAMKFFADEWGIQADHSRTTIYVAADALSLASVLPADYTCGSTPTEVEDSWGDAEAWVCPGRAWHNVAYVVLKEERWGLVRRKAERASVEGRYDLVHEYMHAVQLQLTGGSDPLSDRLHPAWLTEGSAHWTAGLFYMGDIDYDRDWLRRDNERRLLSLGYDEPNLVSLERFASPDSHEFGEHHPWAYELGSVAMELLAGSALDGRHVNQDSIIEYWRQSAYRIQVLYQSNPACDDEYTTCIPGLGDDETDADTTIIWGLDDDETGASAGNAPWDLAFERAFGRTIYQFYSEFEEYLIRLRE